MGRGQHRNPLPAGHWCAALPRDRVGDYWTGEGLRTPSMQTSRTVPDLHHDVMPFSVGTPLYCTHPPTTTVLTPAQGPISRDICVQRVSHLRGCARDSYRCYNAAQSTYEALLGSATTS